MLAEGMSGAEIAAKLVLSPETVRTHIRNAMSKLGASTRSQAVVLALQRQEVADAAEEAEAPSRSRPAADRRKRAPKIEAEALQGMLADLCELPDVEAAVALLTEEDGLGLRRVASASAEGAAQPDLPERVALGEGPLGRVVLNRRAAVIPSLGSNSTRSGTALAAPILADRQTLGVLGLVIRTSRPAGQGELLVLQALVNRIAQVLDSGDDVGRRLEATVERFGASWSATTG